jgi:hypothetical protein
VTVVDFMVAMSDDMSANIAASITAPVSIVSSIAALTLVGDVIANDLIALLGQIIGFVVANYQAAINTSFIEMCKCEMYCELKEQGGWSSAIWEPWKERVRNNPIYTGGNYQAFEIFLGFSGGVDDNEWNARASVGNASPSAFCMLCECGCDAISITWTATGTTPDGWETLGTVTTAFWVGDDTDLNGDYSGATRADNADWEKSLSSASPVHMGIKYVFDAPCAVSHVKFTMNAPTDNSKRMAIALLRDDDIMEVVDNALDTFPTPADMTRDVTFDPIVAKEVWLLATTGAGSESGVFKINQTTEID